jgi:hypothetical protein
MRTKTLHVRLNTASTPPVTIGEDSMAVGQAPIRAGVGSRHGPVRLGVRRHQAARQGAPLPNPPFSTPSISNSQIIVTDDNKDSDDHGTFSYSICVKVGSTPYWSDPEIINRGG